MTLEFPESPVTGQGMSVDSPVLFPGSFLSRCYKHRIYLTGPPKLFSKVSVLIICHLEIRDGVFLLF